MNTLIENLNQWGGNLLRFAWPMLWQSSLLIAFVFALDLLLARRIRASVRYALWLAVLVKLLLPPTLALPTGAAWWLFQAKSAPAPVAQNYTVTYSDAPVEPYIAPASTPMPVPPPVKLESTGWMMLGAGMVSAGLLLWLTVRWWQVARMVRRATMTEEFSASLAEVSRLSGASGVPRVRLKIVEGTMSPAVCGLFRPVILLPRALAETLSPSQLRAVLLHEMFHLRRGDVWVNCAQALLQIAYWWHPLLWVANARIRRVREEAVDDAVMLALREDADGYAPTLLEVAKLAFRRPLLSLGLVGIMESRSALRQRIERLVDFRAPRRAGLTLASLFGIFVFSAVALPMGEAPARVEPQVASEQPGVDAAAPDELEVTLKVDPAIFTNNVKAQAAKLMRSPADDYGFILNDILRNENVNLMPPHGIAFDTRTGEITTKNTAAQLDIVRQVIEQLNRADGKCELPLHHSTYRRSAVLFEAAIYQLPASEFPKFVSGLDLRTSGQGSDACWAASPEQFQRLTNQLAVSGLRPVQRPRIQTSSGVQAQFFVGTGVGTNTFGTELDCLPFVNEGMIELTLQGRVDSDPAAAVVVKNQFNARTYVENHGGVVVRVENVDGVAESNLVVCIGAQILTNPPVHFQQRLQKIIKRPDGARVETQGTSEGKSLPVENGLFQTRLYKIDTNTFLKNFKAQSPAFDLSGAADPFQAASLAAHFAITNTGLNLESPPGKAFFFNEHDSMLYVKTTSADMEMINRVITNLCPSSASQFQQRLQTIIKRADKTSTGKGTTNELSTRTFKVDKRAFEAAMTASGASLKDKKSFPKQFFSAFGVDADSPAGKAVFYNDRNDMLLVRASEPDLDVIDKGLQVMNTTAPQVYIKAQFYKVPEKMVGELAKLPGPTNDLTVAGATALLSPKETVLFLNALRSIHGLETLAKPQCTTTSGRQVKVMTTEVVNVVTNMSFREVPTRSVTTNYVMHGKPVLTTNVVLVGEVAPKTKKLEYGPVLDIVPYVLVEWPQINLTVTATDTKFLGYLEAHKNFFGHIESGWPTRYATNSTGDKITLQQFFPLIQANQATTTATLADGQTLVMFPTAEPVTSLNQDKEWSPFLAGRAKEIAAKNPGGRVVVLVTAEIVDQAGNRMQADAR